LIRPNTIQTSRWRRLILCSLLLPGLLQTYLPICDIPLTQSPETQSPEIVSNTESGTLPKDQGQKIMPHCRCSAARRTAGQCCCARPKPSGQKHLLGLLKSGELCGDYSTIAKLAAAKTKTSQSITKAATQATPDRAAFIRYCPGEQQTWSVATFKSWCPTTSIQSTLVLAIQTLFGTDVISQQHQDDPPEPPPPESCILSAWQLFCCP